MRKISEIMKDVEKLNIQYNGFDRLECADSFTFQQYEWNSTLILISPNDIRFQTRRKDDDFKFSQTSFDFDLFNILYELYQYINSTKKSIPKKYAKNQDRLDDMFEFENGFRI